MKKVLAILCVLAMVFSFAACSSSKKNEKEEEKSSYEDAVEIYQKAMSGDFKQIKKMIPEEVWELYEEETGESIDDLIEEMEDSYADYKEELKEEFGSDFKVTVSVAEAEQCDEDMLDKIAEAINEEYEIKKSNITDAYEVTLTLKIKGSEDTETEEEEAYIVQISNDWYIVSYYEYEDEAYVSFAFM